MSIEISGLDSVLSNLEDINRRIKQAVPKALTDVGLDLLGKSKEKAPIDTGDLRGTGFMNLEDNGKTAVIGFTEIYALRQHEGLEYKHPLGGEAKYLENPLKENTQKYIKHIKDAIGKVVD